MEITSEVHLRGTAWNQAINAFSKIFATRPHYMLYMLAMSIGIMYDQRIEKPEENGEDVRSIPRNVFHNNDNGRLDFMFQAAILSTTTESFSEEERLELAFGEKSTYPEMVQTNKDYFDNVKNVSELKSQYTYYEDWKAAFDYEKKENRVRRW